MREGTRTPWGPAQYIEPVGPEGGVYSVSTASHGGYYVPDVLLSRIPQEARDYAARWSGSHNWYEEDCASAAVVLAFPELFTPRLIESAKLAAAQYFPAAVFTPEGR